jgi:hypothetical protein
MEAWQAEKRPQWQKGQEQKAGGSHRLVRSQKAWRKSAEGEVEIGKAEGNA